MAPAVVEKAAQGSAAKRIQKGISNCKTVRLRCEAVNFNRNMTDSLAQAPPVLLSLQYFTLFVTVSHPTLQKLTIG